METFIDCTQSEIDLVYTYTEVFKTFDRAHHEVLLNVCEQYGLLND